MKKVALWIMLTLLCISFCSCTVINKNIINQNFLFSLFPNGINETLVDNLNRENGINPGTYSDGGIAFDISEEYVIDFATCGFSQDMSQATHIVLEVYNPTSEPISEICLFGYLDTGVVSSTFTDTVQPFETKKMPMKADSFFGDYRPEGVSALSIMSVKDEQAQAQIIVKDLYFVSVPEETLWNMIYPDITEKLRDPFVLIEDGVYYVYGTNWKYYKNTSGSLSGHWDGPYDAVDKSTISDYVTNPWAPEVYKYDGAYYMFTTYYSSVTEHRGCTILKADSPEGPFKLHSNGQVTPSDWDAIDGTLYIDNDGQPWMVFVHEWTSTDYGGSFAYAKLSDDLTHFITEPVEMFRSSEVYWAGGVTDGCFMYTTEDGDLLMLWSSYGAYGYCVGIARSTSGLVTGPWEDKGLLYSSAVYPHPGGHGMIFTDTDGKMYLSIHVSERTPVFVRVKEKNNMIVPDLPTLF